ncbi:DNA polymerase III subunit alpha [Fodinicola feengrottensis]|uniref:DNA-directed DNA polymerase n=1 Tax=Fodinicola feengrottensis TaxID=435914 RepID=A0ABN2HR39_9ACTN
MSSPGSSSDSFVHLHVHTEYSMLDGAARLKDLFAEVARQEMPAVAMTDHGNMHGANDFYKQAMKAGVTPVIGIEAYVAPASRYHKQPVKWGDPHQKRDDVSGGGHYTHKTLWARNAQGLHNLFKLTSRAYTEGFVRKWARMDDETLAEHAAGVMATTGCPSGEVQTRLRLGQYDQALASAAKYRDIFGADNYFIELMDHGLDIELKVRDGLLRIGKELGLPFVVTNDSHYTHEADADSHDALLCIQTGKTLADPDRFKFSGSGYYIKTADEMRGIDSSDAWQEGCRNTLLIAERVDTTGMFQFKDLSPRYPVPEGETEESWFRIEVERGMRRRFPDGIPPKHQEQADYEMKVILDKGYASYFLVVADFIVWSKNNGVRVGPGRGSAAGAIVAYAMGITDLDPLLHGLFFERFLNPERESMPDIDIDFDERGRGEVIKYVTEKWGEDKIAQIATYGTIKAKAAIKDAGRIQGFPYALGDRITKAFPPAVMGKDIPLSGVFDEKHPRYNEAGELRRLYNDEVDVRQVFDRAKGIEGLIRQTGVHAAGVIMSSETITDYIPVMRRDSDGVIITQFDYPTCESLGLLKMDFLGLRNLTIIEDALRNVKLNHDVDIDLDHLALDDPKTYELLGRGDTLGVFQFDGGPMRSLLRLMQPDNFEDISAVGALYRPGPMGANSHINYALRKNKQQDITPIHPELEDALKDILSKTYGLIVYQEQVMEIAQKVGNYTLGQADLLRRAMGKKKKEVLDKEFVPFSEGMKSNGFSMAAVKALWDILVPFSDYAFNKAHSAAYGVVSYWTAFLKANYPAEYMAALLTSVRDDKDKSAVYLNECRRMGIQVLPPDVNSSSADYTPVGTDIRFGLAAVRNVGANVVAAIERCRKEKGAYTDFYDFLRKVDAVACNKKTMEALVKAGAFDSLNHPRRGLLAIHADAVDAFSATKRNEAIGQFDLFGDVGADEEAVVVTPAIPAGEWEKADLLAFEREMLGLYVSDHPLSGVEHVLSAAADTSLVALNEDAVPDGKLVTVAGILGGVTRKVTKAGKSWAMAQLEDLSGSVEALFFPATYELVSMHIAEDAIVVLKARVDKRDDVPRLIVSDLSIPNLTDISKAPVTLSLAANRCTPPLVNQLREVLVTHPGTTEVRLKVTNGGQATMLRLQDGLRVTPSPALMGDLKALLGSGCIVA